MTAEIEQERRTLEDRKLAVTTRVAEIKRRRHEALAAGKRLPPAVLHQFEAERARLGIEMEKIQLRLGQLRDAVRDKNRQQIADITARRAAERAANVKRNATADRHFRYLARARMSIDLYDEIYAEAQRRAEKDLAQ